MASSAVYILGMHRSGTSCLAGILEEAGLYLGPVNRNAPANPKGNRENRQVMVLNDEVLQESGGSWLRPPREVVWRDAHRARRDDLINSYPTDRLWGLKDPRLLLTLEGWLEALPSARLVGTVRHPAAVAASLRARNDLPESASFDLWYAYNSRLLAFHERYGCDLVCFDWDEARYVAKVAEMARRIGLSPPVQGLSFFENRYRRQTPVAGSEVPREVLELYHDLLARTDVLSDG